MRNAIADTLWRELRRRREPATIRELQLALRADRRTIRSQVCRWESAGLVHRTPERKPVAMVMSAHAAKLPKPPRAVKGSKSKSPCQRQRVWTSMRVLKRFDVPTLMIAAQANERGTETFLNALMRAGYVNRVQRGHHKLGTISVYQLVKATGPKAPTIYRGGQGAELVDRNDGSRHDISPRRSEDSAVEGGDINHVC